MEMFSMQKKWDAHHNTRNGDPYDDIKLRVNFFVLNYLQLQIFSLQYY